MMAAMLRRLSRSALLLSLLFAAVSLGMFLILRHDHGKAGRTVTGEIKVLYTTDVGGAIDPCG